MTIAEATAAIKTVLISEATAADNELVAAVTGKKIRVLDYVLVSAGAVVATFKSGSDAITGAMTLAASTVVPANGGGAHKFETAAGEALNLALSGTVQVSGHLTYQEVK